MKKRTLAALMAAAVLLTGCKDNSSSVSDGSSDVSGADSGNSDAGTSNSDDNTNQPADLGGDVPYTWGNVAIGCGGYTPEVYYNAGEEGLIYARTDIGGAYRLDKDTQTWIPLTDEFGTKEYSFYGIDGLITDPVEPNRVYLLAGMYTKGWLDISNAYILRSTDYGENWEQIPLEFESGGNEPNRFCDRLELDPQDNKTLYAGARNGTLWKSTDYGSTWTKLPLPEVDLRQEDGYTLGVTFISFDENNDLYVGVASDSVNTRYFRSKDGGASFEVLEGQPNAGIPYHGVSDRNGHMYFVNSAAAGPYQVSSGTLKKYTIADGTWEDVTPDMLTNGVGDVEVDPRNPDILTVSSIGKWGANENDCLYRSLDGGATWDSIFTGDGQDRKFTVDYSETPWLDWGGETAKLGWMMGDIAINPFDGSDMMYGTGATIFRTTNLADWDNGGTVSFKVMSKGYEETNVSALAAPPTGDVQLYSALWDIDGFSHKDVDVVPDKLNNNGSMSSANSIAFAWKSPNIVVRSGSKTGVEISTDYGETWKESKPKDTVGQAGRLAVNADGTSIYWVTDRDAYIFRSDDLGESWVALEKAFSGPAICCDSNDPDALYVYSSEKLYISRDRGGSFEPLNQFTPSSGKLIADPETAGTVYIASKAGGLYRVSNYGAADEDFYRYPAFPAAANFALGKAESDGAPLAMYVIGTLKDTDFVGVYRSTDGGETWLRINDDKHEFGAIGDTLAADMNVFGQVYFGTNGRGIIMGRDAS